MARGLSVRGAKLAATLPADGFIEPERNPVRRHRRARCATPDKTCRSACTPAWRRSARHRWTRAILRRHHAPRMIHQDLDGARSR